MEAEAKREAARRQVEAMTGFYIHAAVFAVVIAILFLFDASTGDTWWVQWPFLGWGAGLALHWFLVFARTPTAVRDWQERKIQELADKM